MNQHRTLVLLLGVLLLFGAGLLLFQLPERIPSGTSAPHSPPEGAAPHVEDPLPVRALDDPLDRPSTPRPLEVARTDAAVRGRVVSAVGTPVADGVLTLFTVGAGMGPFRPRTNTGRSGHTGADGSFVLAGIPADTSLGVEISAGDWAPTLVEPFVVTTGQTLNLGDLVLEAGLSIAGTVRDRSAQPLAQAVVTVRDDTVARRSSTPALPVASTTSGPDGSYRIEHLATRQYTLHVEREGYVPVEGALSLVLGSNRSEVQQDFHLERAECLLAGQVLGPQGEPVTEATVRVSRRVRRGNTYFLDTRVTDSQGRFRFEAMPTGKVRLDLFSARWYLAQGMEVATSQSDLVILALRGVSVRGRLVGVETPPASFQVTARGNPRTGAAVLPGGASMQTYRDADPPGTFVFDGLRPGSFVFEVKAQGYALTTSHDVILGPSMDWAEVVIPLRVGGSVTGRLRPARVGVPVELRGPDFDPSMPVEAAFPTPPIHGLVTSTDAAGRFVLEHVPEGEYTLSARSPQAPPIHVHGLWVHEAQITSVGELLVRPGGSIEGQVSGPDGLPRRGARVSAVSDRHHGQAVTDAQGAFRLDGLPMGIYELRVTSGLLWEALQYETRAQVHVQTGEVSAVQLTLAKRSLPLR